jgi:hypothetical protein
MVGFKFVDVGREEIDAKGMVLARHGIPDRFIVFGNWDLNDSPVLAAPGLQLKL